MPQKTILVTGASRGIGHEIASLLLQRPETTVIAAVRDSQTPSGEKSLQALISLSTHATSKLLTTSIDSASDASAPAAVSTLRSEHGIDRLDAVIAAAGTVSSMASVDDTSAADVLSHVDVNACGVLRLWQAVSPLLLSGTLRTPASKTPDSATPVAAAPTVEASDPLFLALSSSCGSISGMEPVPGLAYGISKAALNFLVRKIHQEHGAVCAVAVHPGWVQTAMGQFAADAWGAKEPPMGVRESAGAVVRLMDGMTRLSAGGRFLSYDGSEIEW